MYDAWGQFSRFFGVGSEHLLMSITSRSDATLDEIESAGPAGAGTTTKMAASAEMHAGTGRI